MTTTHTRSALALAAGASLVLAAMGCGSSPKSDTGEGSKRLVAFIPPTANRYINQWAVGATAEAARLGYSLTILESADKDDQAAKIDQELQKDPPAGWLYWPVANKALVGKQAQLADAAPLVMTNQLPEPDSSYVAYAGVNDIFNGHEAGEMLAGACAASPTAECAGGIIVRFPPGYSAGDDRITGFSQSGMGQYPVLETIDSGFQETEGYDSSKGVIQSLGDDITWVYATNDALAAGVAKALAEAGRKPGTDVLVVGGTCHGDSSHLVSGELVGTGLQSGYLEGGLAVQTMDRYLATGEVTEGDIDLPADPNTVPPDSGAPHKRNFLPNPTVPPSQEAYDATTLWGKTMAQLCDY